MSDWLTEGMGKEEGKAGGLGAEGVENALIEEDGAAGGEAGHEVLFVETEGVKRRDGVLLGERRDRDGEFAQGAGRQGANVGTAGAADEGFLSLRQIQKPTQIIG